MRKLLLPLALALVLALALPASGAAQSGRGGGPPATATPMRLAVVTVTQTSTAVPRTNQFTRAYKDGHHANFAEQSLGKLVFGPTVTYGPYYLHPEIGCHDYEAARNLAAADGWVATAYWQTVVLMPDCGADYPEHIGDWPLYKDWWQHDFIQEGFRFGVTPIGVGLYRCKDTNGQWVMLAPAPQCTTSRYEDLGPTGSGEDAGLGHYPFAAKLSAGWVSLANLQTISADGDYTVLPLEYPTTGIQNLRVSTGTLPPLDIEFRRPSKYEIVRPASFFDGVFLRFGGGLLLPTPTSDWNFPQLPRGRSAYDPFHKVTITVLSADDSGAKVRFKFDQPVVGQPTGQPTCTVAAPSVTVTPATQTVAPGASATYTVSVVNRDSSTCGDSDITVAAMATATATASAPSGGGGGGGGSTATTATFVERDTTTIGNWAGRHGSAGAVIPFDAQTIPSWAQFNVLGATPTNWGLTGMQEWLSTAAGGTHIASFWAAATELSFFVNLTDGQSHQFALYGFAGGCFTDSASNIQTVDILDAATDTVLDTRILTPSGQYLVWSLTGNIRVRVSHGRCGIAVNGVFFE